MTAVLRLLPAGRVTSELTRPGALLPDGPVLVGRQKAEGLDEHHLRLGVRSSAAGPEVDVLLGLLAETGLAGRGGGHFPVAAKWRAARDAGGGGTLVANAAESEPASAKDATLIQRHPHLVLDGLALAAEALGSQDCVVWLHEGADASHLALNQALAERRGREFRDAPVRVLTGPDRYLTGESSAIVHALEGGPPLPLFTRVPAAVSGAHGRPTVVHNVETLARVALLGRGGAQAQVPSSLITVVLPGSRIVMDVPADVTLSDAIHLAGWPRTAPPRAVLVGGYGGSWMRWSSVHALELGDLPLGAGVLAPLGQDECGLAETAVLSRWMAGQSAQQCGPCMFGLPSLAAQIADLAAGRLRKSGITRIRRQAGQVVGRGACHHPDGAARLVTSALEAFAEDVRAHIAGQPCRWAAGSTRLLMVSDRSR